MKSRVLLILFFILLLPSVSNAAYKYIKVTNTKTKHENELWLIKAKLNNIGLDMISMQTNKNYLIYSGPYKNEKSAKVALRAIKRYFSNAIIVGQNKVNNKIVKTPLNKDANSSINVNTKQTPIEVHEDNIEQTPIEVQEVNTKQTIIEVEGDNTQLTNIETNEDAAQDIVIDDYNGFFIGVSLGFAYTPYEHSTQSGVVIISKSPSAYNISYSLESGYVYKSGVFVSLKYLKANSADITIDNLLASINYKLELQNKIVPFIGILAGQSLLNRKFVPLDNSQSIDMQSESLIYGFEIGASYDFYENFETYISYQYIIMNHAAILAPSTGVSRLEHNSLHNFQAGVRF